MKKNVLVTLACLFTSFSLISQSDFDIWQSVDPATVDQYNQIADNLPEQHAVFQLDLEKTKRALTPTLGSTEYQNTTIQLPMPDGQLKTFLIKEAPIMEKPLAEKYPMIKNFNGVCTKDKSILAKIGYNTFGFHAVIRKRSRQIYIDVVNRENPVHYVSYYPGQMERIERLACGTDHTIDPNDPLAHTEAKNYNRAHFRNQGLVSMRQYRLAVSTTGEFSLSNGVTKPNVLSVINTAVTRLNEIYEYENAITFTLIANNDRVIYLDRNTDPFVDHDNADLILDDNQEVLDTAIGSTNYDIGQLFTTSPCYTQGNTIGGRNSLSNVCVNERKGMGVTCANNGNDLQRLVVEVMAHEIGHGFSATHSWTHCPSSPGAYDPTAAYEPGSGTTIMSYQGSCGTSNVGFETDPYFHVGNLEQIYNFSREGDGSTCANLVSTSNNDPEVVLPYQNDFYIPISTPFKLTAQGSDVDGDDITYCWEQYDLGPYAPMCTLPDRGPRFRSYLPTSDPTRIFPRIEDIITNTQRLPECLPDASRVLNFRCTVRDYNDEAGGANWEQMRFNATAGAGPFLVTNPSNTGIQWEAGSYSQVIWDVANTNNTTVNCQHVNILLSTDSGRPPYITLSENTPNDGAQFVAIPEMITSNARIIIEAADNIFFDMSNNDFSIIPASNPTVYFNVSPNQQQVCIPTAPNVDLEFAPILGYDSLVTISITGLPMGATASFDNNPFKPSEGNSASLDVSTVAATGDYPIEFMLTGPNLDTLRRGAILTLVSSDFSNFTQSTPLDGATGVSELPTFTWTNNPNLEAVEIEIATSPLFGASIVESANGLTGTTYNPAVILKKNTPYYWRITPSNKCGEGAISAIWGFQTETQSCAIVNAANDLPLNISGSGLPVLTNTLNISAGGAISDINVVNLKGDHDRIRHLDCKLTSPQGTEVILFEQIQCGSSLLDIGLDDQAPDDIPCPSNDGQAHKPQNALSAFNNENSTGTWTMTFSVNDNAGNGGTIESWGLEICSNVNLSGPFLVNNNALEVPPGMTNPIFDNLLLADDNDNTPVELKFTIVTPPANGTIYYAGNALTTGGTFTQRSINAGNIEYTNDINTSATADQFSFTVEDGDNGWLKANFDIVIDPNATVPTRNLAKANEVKVFPNPAQDLLTVQFKTAPQGNLNWKLVDLQGRILTERQLGFTGQNLPIDTKHLPNGIYFLKLDWNETTISKRIVIQR